ncbi:MAG: efflux RND transporter periplasmic adaptor subunit [Mesorhizobium sp.]
MRHGFHRQAGVAFAFTFTVLAASGACRAESAAAAVAQDEANVRTVSTFVASSAMTEWNLSFNGALVARDEIAVGSPLQDQRIATVEVEVGDRVKAGQVLVRLETEKLDNQLREAEGRLARAGATLAQQEATLAQAQANLVRANRLRASGTIAEQAYDDRVSAVTVAQQGAAAERAQYAQAEAQLAESRRERERAVVLAPTDGLVSERQARAGALAGSEPLIRLMRDGETELAAEIPESELPLLAVGQSAKLSFPGSDKVMAGHVRLVAPKIDRETRLGVAKITFKTDAQLFPGAFGRAEIVISRREAIVIDDSALLYGRDPGKSSVFTVENGHVLKRVVELGQRRNGQVEIRLGLAAGERVVAKAAASLREGDAVKTVDIQTSSESAGK